MSWRCIHKTTKYLQKDFVGMPLNLDLSRKETSRRGGRHSADDVTLVRQWVGWSGIASTHSLRLLNIPCQKISNAPLPHLATSPSKKNYLYQNCNRALVVHTPDHRRPTSQPHLSQHACDVTFSFLYLILYLIRAPQSYSSGPRLPSGHRTSHSPLFYLCFSQLATLDIAKPGRVTMSIRETERVIRVTSPYLVWPLEALLVSKRALLTPK